MPCYSYTSQSTVDFMTLSAAGDLKQTNCCSSRRWVVSDSWDPMNCSPPGSTVYRISQARILKWVAIPFSRGSSWLRDWTHIPCIGRSILYHWATWEALNKHYWLIFSLLYKFVLQTGYYSSECVEIVVFIFWAGRGWDVSAIGGSPGLEEGSRCLRVQGSQPHYVRGPRPAGVHGFSLSSLVVNLATGYFSVLLRFLFWFSVGVWSSHLFFLDGNKI